MRRHLRNRAVLPLTLAVAAATLTAATGTAAFAHASVAARSQAASVQGSRALTRFTLGDRTYTAPATALPAPPRTPVATGSKATQQLTITAASLSGEPDTGGSVFVYNVDNSNLFASGGAFSHGVAKFSVPVGHYWAVGIFMQSSGHQMTEQRVVVLPQFTVAGKTKVHIAERAASSEVTATTPRPSAAETSTFEIRRPSVTGPVQYWEFNDTGISLWVSPTATRPTVGKLQTFTNQQLVSPNGTAGVPYEYDLAYQGPNGVIPGQHHVVTSASLATVDATYIQDVPTAGSETRFGLFHDQLRDLVLEADNRFSLPRHQIEYMLGNPRIFWFASVIQCYPSKPCPGGQNDAVRSFRAGEHLTGNWNAYPLHPGANVNLLGPASPQPTMPSASRAGNLLTLDVTPFSDSQPGHTGEGFSSGTYQVDANGVQVAAGNAAKAAKGAPDLHLRVKLKPGPATVRFTLNVSRAGKAYPLSPQTRTVWTWRSVPSSRVTLPPGWVCAPAQPGGPPGTRHCAVQPMMTLGYQVARMTPDGSVPSGAQTITITAGHLQLTHPSPIVRLRAWVSFDGGKTWRLATVTRHAQSEFTATFTAQAGTYPALRVQATGTSGGSITETIARAYRVGT
jgi:hypothetical protein